MPAGAAPLGSSPASLLTPSVTSRSTGVTQGPGANGRSLFERADGSNGTAFTRSPTHSRESLAAGVPFAAEVQEAWLRIAGVPVSRDALTKLYGACLPGTTVLVRNARYDAVNDSLRYDVTWLDHSGRAAAQTSRTLLRNEDGSLELHRTSSWVSPSHRGRGLSTEVMAQELSLLRALSHGLSGVARANTRMSLRAGSGDDINDDFLTSQNVGTYVWAHLFDYPANHGVSFRSQARYYPWSLAEAGATADERAGQKADFARFFEDACATRALNVTDDQRDAVLAAIGEMQHPWELANFDPLPELRLEGVGLGKAFLLSGCTGQWDGVFFVNEDRHGQHGRFARYLERTRARSAERAVAWVADVESRLAHPASSVRKEAVTEVGVLGGPEWQERLQEQSARDPAVRDEVTTALQRLTGARLQADLASTVMQVDEGARLRVNAATFLSDLQETPAVALFEHLVKESPASHLSCLALEALTSVAAESEPEAVAACARQLWAAMPDDLHGNDRTYAQQMVAWSFAQLPPEWGEPGLREVLACLPSEERRAMVELLLLSDTETFRRVVPHPERELSHV